MSLLPVALEYRLSHQDVIRWKTQYIFDMTVSDFDDIKTVMISVVIITNITLNLLVIAVIVRYPQLREDRTALFMFSLTLSDLANGITAMPLSATLCYQATQNVGNMTEYLPKIHAALSAWFNHGRRSVGDGGDASPHFSAWWGPHRKCPPHFFA